MKLSDAFRLLEDGEILTDGNILFKLSDGILMYAFLGSNDWYFTVGRVGQFTFENFHIYEKPKEKVQYYKAFYGVKGEGNKVESSPNYTSKEDFLRFIGMSESRLEFIQMIKVGDPT